MQQESTSFFFAANCVERAGYVHRTSKYRRRDRAAIGGHAAARRREQVGDIPLFICFGTTALLFRGLPFTECESSDFFVGDVSCAATEALPLNQAFVLGDREMAPKVCGEG